MCYILISLPTLKAILCWQTVPCWQLWLTQELNLSSQTGRAIAKALSSPCPLWQCPQALPSQSKTGGTLSKWLFVLEPVYQQQCQAEPATHITVESCLPESSEVGNLTLLGHKLSAGINIQYQTPFGFKYEPGLLGTGVLHTPKSSPAILTEGSSGISAFPSVMHSVLGLEASFYMPFHSFPVLWDLTIAAVSSAIHINYTDIHQFTLLSSG